VRVGNNLDFSGLAAEVWWENEGHKIESPLAVSFPPGLNHTYRFLNGSGKYWSIVVTP
jgi:hypothetical protein